MGGGEARHGSCRALAHAGGARARRSSDGGRDIGGQLYNLYNRGRGSMRPAPARRQGAGGGPTPGPIGGDRGKPWGHAHPASLPGMPCTPGANWASAPRLRPHVPLTHERGEPVDRNAVPFDQHRLDHAALALGDERERERAAVFGGLRGSCTIARSMA
jgi:hypothetical protein